MVPRLKRTFGLLDSVALVLSAVIGAGILSTPGLIAGYLGRPWLIMAIWAFGGISVTLTAFMFAELAAMMPEAGGKYIYVARAYGEGAGCFVGWADVLLTRSFTTALKVVLIGQYLVVLVGRGSPRAATAVVVVGFVLLHLRGVQAGRLAQNASTAVKLVLLLGVVCAGFAVSGGGAWHVPSALPGRGLAGFALASQAVFFSYYGTEQTLGMAGEVRAPGRNLPRMLFLGLAGSAAVFLLLNAAYLSALPTPALAGSTNVARDVLAKAMGSRAGLVVIVVALAVLINSTNLNFLNYPRVPFGLARDGLAPRALTRVNPRGTPTAALYLVAALTLVVALSGTVELIIRLMSFMTLAVDGTVLTTLLVLRHREPQTPRPFRVPLFPLVPFAALASYATMLAMVTFTQPTLAASGAALLALAAATTAIALRIRGPLVAVPVAQAAD